MGLFRRRKQDPGPGGAEEAPGWHAIEAAFATRYGTPAPAHVAPTIQPPFAGGVLNGMSPYRGEAHWHFVTFGLTTLFVEEDEDDTSGWGYELTLTTPLTDEPPPWCWHAELEAMVATSTDAVLEHLRSRDRLCLIDPDRPSVA